MCVCVCVCKDATEWGNDKENEKTKMLLEQKICILEWILKDHVTGVMVAENSTLPSP